MADESLRHPKLFTVHTLLICNTFQQACGYEFTNKLHRMFTDISVSTDLNNKFNSYLKETCGEIGKKLESSVKVRQLVHCIIVKWFSFPGVNLSIKVLQAGAWPLGPTQVVIPFSIPQEFERSIRMVRICHSFDSVFATNDNPFFSVRKFLPPKFQRSKIDLASPFVSRRIENDIPQQGVHYHNANVSNGNAAVI